MKLTKRMLKKLIREALEMHMAPENLSTMSAEEAYGLGYNAGKDYVMNKPTAALSEIESAEAEGIAQGTAANAYNEHYEIKQRVAQGLQDNDGGWVLDTDDWGDVIIPSDYEGRDRFLEELEEVTMEMMGLSLNDLGL